MADVHFIFKKENKIIPAHKFLLASRSAVFQAQFYGEIPAGSGGSKDEVEIEDIEPAAFVEVLRYIYYEESNISGENVMVIMYASKKYMLPGLTSVCTKYLDQSVDLTNACLILNQSISFDEKELTEKCFKIIDSKTEEAFASDDFANLDKRVMEILIARDTLKIKEISLFEAVVKWASHECKRRELPGKSENLREVMGDILYLIRMPLMSPEEFTNGPYKSGILSPEESSVMLASYHSEDIKQSMFPDKKRKPVRSK